MIAELLTEGKENARSGRELASLLNCNIRMITAQIERERREGAPICANMNGQHAGYFLAENEEELEEYCRRLYSRGGELFKTRRALLEVLEQIRKKKEQEAAADE
jgi:biotin operon repressor